MTRQQRFDQPGAIRELLQSSHLGPGRYNSHIKSLNLKDKDRAYQSSMFKSAQRRFSLPSAAPGSSDPLNAALQAFVQSTATPGPGEYQVLGSIGTKSYNVTIEGQASARKARLTALGAGAS